MQVGRVGGLKRLQSDLERVMSSERQSLIDRVINELGGKWMFDDARIRMQKTIITRSEFEARKAERQKKPSWKGMPQWANWIAQDECGRWFWFTHKPEVNGLEFVEPSDDGKVFLATTGGEVIGDWRDTLEQRPTNSTCVADGLREIREAFADWGVSIAGAQVTHKGTTPNGMHKLEVGFDENHIVEPDEKAGSMPSHSKDKVMTRIGEAFAELAKEASAEAMAIINNSPALQFKPKAYQSIGEVTCAAFSASADRMCKSLFCDEPKLTNLADWYDYEAQKPVGTAPNGAEIEVFKANRVTFAAHAQHLIGATGSVVAGFKSSCSVEMTAVDLGVHGCHCIVTEAIRPLDWDRKLQPQPEPEPSPELSFHLSTAFNELQASARLLPEDDPRKQMLVSLANGVSAVREGV